MEKAKLIEFIISQEKGFSSNEKEKALGPYDAIYMDEKIKEHLKKAKAQKRILFIMPIIVLISTVLFILSPWISVEVTIWIKGILVGLLVGAVIFYPFSIRNHASIAMVLRVIRELHAQEQSQE